MSSCDRCNAPLLKAVCTNCRKPFGIYPFLIGGDASRTELNCVALAVAELTEPFYVMAFFGREQGKGPYVVDVNIARHIDRLVDMHEDQRSWCTVFQANRPCFLHLDIDDKREQRVACGTVLFGFAQTFIDLVSESMFGNTITKWVVLEAKNTDKTSAHAHATSMPFTDITHVAFFMAAVKTAIETAFNEIEDRNHLIAGKICWREGAKYCHVLDYTIYHVNALLKLPFHAKVGKKPMLPMWVEGAKYNSKKHSDRMILNAGLAHSNTIEKLPIDQFVRCAMLEPLRIAPAIPLAIVDDEAIRAALATIDDAAVYTLKQKADGVYVHYKGKHTCASGQQHDSNNATIRVTDAAYMYRCFSCSEVVRIAKAKRVCVREAVPAAVEHEALEFETFNPKAVALFKQFKDGELRRSQLIDAYLQLVHHCWVQVSEQKVIYAELTTVYSMLGDRPGLQEVERKLKQQALLRVHSHCRHPS